MSRIRIGLIGAGLFVEDTHLPAILALDQRYEIVAVASRTQDSATRLAAKIPYPVEATTDVDGILDRGDIDAVDIAVPIGAMSGILRKALASDKHVFSEKPLAPTREIAEDLLALDARNGKGIWMVAENWRMEPAFLQAARLIEAATIGKPQFVCWQVFAGLEKSDRYYSTQWRRSPENAAGFLLDGGVHHAATLRLVLGEVSEVTAVTALQREDLPPFDTICATLLFENGAVGSYQVTYAYQAPWSSALRIVGDKGCISVDTRRLELTRDGITEVTSFESRHFAVHDELMVFADAIEAGRLTQNTPSEALMDLMLIEAMLSSARSGKRVSLR